MPLKFPYPEKRENQDKMIQKVEECIKNRKNLLVHAPTGIGKTVGVLYPAIKSASKLGLNVFFLTPRHSQHLIALETLKKIGETKAVDIIGKRWLCHYFYDDLGQSDFQELCNYLKKEEKCEFYNKIFRKGELTEDAKNKIKEISKEILSSEEVKKKCKEFCPYEILCLAAKRSVVVVADYFHLFNPFVSETFLAKINKRLEESIIIVDEAHQLPGRAIDLISSKLTTFVLNNAINEAKDLNREFSLDIDNFRLGIEEIARNKLGFNDEAYIDKEEIVSLLNSLPSEFMHGLQEISDLVREEGKERSYCSGLLRFLENWINSDENFVRIIKRKETKYGKQFELKLKALLPEKVTSDVINNSYSTILMSATLQPLEMYANLLGVRNYETISFKSIFPPENRLNLIAPIATTKFSKRGDAQYNNYAKIIVKIFEVVNGNTAVFFPSYYFLNKVHDFLRGDLNIFRETPELTKEQKTNLLRQFINSEKSLLFGVQSGSFDQGIDFPNNSLKCIIIAGVALATPDLETKSLIDCYNKNYGKGMEYAYIYPAIQKAIQASGRAIRSERDKAVVIYLDERFLWRNYRLVLSGENFKVSREPWKDIEEWKFREKISIEN
ncbi:MAG: ATP-dependent DNA helicase [Candidatus Aenigmarchaeota archaeon]|nr:ATP-dependent DNA helicase [Candidatus Aenigmarchaeota archaeon]